eukprot:CAMPEP_0198502060 /NCGR_PEP_ID=MMETSP1462-20131121/9083_1 /TAXON_ID=1333877 /ORGANISM="Brandtodinium nutriculum, Strain RCC3387" /LENGTH=126 /DNA_ID=CAMNT_0044231127 /DNA_START=23 /DNA_END=403 /DNA_ORIENTATION=-
MTISRISCALQTPVRSSAGPRVPFTQTILSPTLTAEAGFAAFHSATKPVAFTLSTTRQLGSDKSTSTPRRLPSVFTTLMVYSLLAPFPGCSFFAASMVWTVDGAGTAACGAGTISSAAAGLVLRPR